MAHYSEVTAMAWAASFERKRLGEGRIQDLCFV
jgi:hypothetical protein